MRIDGLPDLPPRPENGHKGTFGTVLVVAGHATMVGAPCFVTSGALRIGCGLVRLAVPADILIACLGLVPAAIGIARDATHASVLAGIDNRTVIAAGPGLGLGSGEKELIGALLKTDRPLVIDGDGLTHLAHLGVGALSREAALVLTPHPGEYARLAHVWRTARLDAGANRAHRQAAAAELARATRAVVVLKGRGTVVSDGVESWVCPSGNAALAIPGSGDVLTGVIAGLLAQGLGPFASAKLATYLHGKAGDAWAEQRPFGLSAVELADLIPSVSNDFKQGR